MTYAELLARLLPARRFGMVFGLERIRALLDALGSPDTRLGTIIHVGGTNGKGSTVAMIAAIVRAGGLRVATYTSPHLSSLRERITIDGAPIDEHALCAAAERVYAHGGDALTFFEQLTAIACVAIADARVDVTILEVGLGGRLDATNAIAAPIAVITGVAMDHESILGDTLAKIAAEKAGIFKAGQRVVIGASGEVAATHFLSFIAKFRGVAVVTEIGVDENPSRLLADPQAALAALFRMLHESRHIVGPPAFDLELLRTGNPNLPPWSSTVDIRDEDAIAQVPPLSLPGEHQRRNAAAALAAIDHLEALGVAKIDAETRTRALASVVHPGRFEVIEGPPRIILDGAHNPHGAEALAATLRSRDERPVLVLAVSADKDVRAIVRALAPVASAIIATRYQQDRAMDPEALAAIAREVVAQAPGEISARESAPISAQAPEETAPISPPVSAHAPGEAARAVPIPVDVARDLAAADVLARGHAARERAPIVIAGSLFLVGEARVRYLGAPADPIVVSDPAPR